MPKQISYYILTAALLIFGLSIGFFAGRTFDQDQVTTGIKNEEGMEPASETGNIYASQTATIRGEITAVNGKTLRVKSLIDDATGTITLSDDVVITKPGDSKPGTDLSSIEQNKEVLIGLEMIQGSYKATSLQYPVPAPSLPPVSEAPATTSASPRTR